MQGRQLQSLIKMFVREFGLLSSEQTPCGQPLSPSQAHALRAIAEIVPCTQQALASYLRVDKSTTSRVVAELVERKWVARTENPQNRRENVLELTPAGADVLVELDAAATNLYAAIWERVPAHKRADVLDALEVLIRAFREVQ